MWDEFITKEDVKSALKQASVSTKSENISNFDTLVVPLDYALKLIDQINTLGEEK